MDTSEFKANFCANTLYSKGTFTCQAAAISPFLRSKRRSGWRKPSARLKTSTWRKLWHRLERLRRQQCNVCHPWKWRSASFKMDMLGWHGSVAHRRSMWRQTWQVTTGPTGLSRKNLCGNLVICQYFPRELSSWTHHHLWSVEQHHFCLCLWLLPLCQILIMLS